jgi:hypothetical protein
MKTIENGALLKMGLQLIGLASLRIPPSTRLARATYDSIKALQAKDGGPMLPNAIKVLGEIGGRVPVLPPVSRCKMACEEIREQLHMLRVEANEHSLANDKGLLRPSVQ